jgi:hypothetical protein
VTDSKLVSIGDVMKDILLLDNIMLSVRSEGAVAELRLDKNTPLRLSGQYVTIGDEKGQWHAHININEANEARFVIEQKENDRKSFSLRFFNSNNSLILRVNFLKMYTPENVIIQESLAQYESFFKKYGGNETLRLEN